MELPKDKPRPVCGECFFCEETIGICEEVSDFNHYGGMGRHKQAVCCDYFVFSKFKE